MMIESLVWSVVILTSPLWLAAPVKLLWGTWTGREPEHDAYRAQVEKVLDAGEPLRRYRKALDREARRLDLDAARQGRIETGLLHPLSIAHFMLLPGLAVWPLMSLIAIPLTLPLIPLIRLMEWVLIDKRLLSFALGVIVRWTRWEVVAIPHLDDGAKQLDPLIVSVSRLPVTVFLGLFAFLMALYLPAPWWLIAVASAVIYLFLASLISIVTAATSGALVFADTAKRRLTPFETMVESHVTPIIGVGLVLLLARQMMHIANGTGLTLFADPVVFAIVVLAVLYTATLIGIAVEFTFFRRRGVLVRDSFMRQVVDDHDPMVYQYTRHLGDMALTPRMRLRAWLDAGKRLPEEDDEHLTFDQLARSKSVIGDVSRPAKPS